MISVGRRIKPQERLRSRGRRIRKVLATSMLSRYKSSPLARALALML